MSTAVPASAPSATRRCTVFMLMHVAVVVGALATPISTAAWIWCAVLFVVRMWGVTAGYHRYFSHKTFKTSRAMQFALAWVAMTSSQRGVLWWAAHHRNHHRRSDQEGDPHSPLVRGFWRSHLYWVFEENNYFTDMQRVGDLSRYPELVWLDRHWWVPPAALAAALWLGLGLDGLIVSFGLSTVLLWHSTFLVNSVCHVFGRRRFDTEDASKNNWFVAALTLGEGWHNNHHHLPSSARMGLAWYELDPTWWSILAMEKLGLVTDVRLTEPRSRRVDIRRDRSWIAWILRLFGARGA